MRLLHLYKSEDYKYYAELLRTIAALSRLFSESSTPYIPYRIAENVFCKAFSGSNLSRSDIAYDAQIGSVCFGIKTFIDKSPWQKIAEFNKQSAELINMEPNDLVSRLATLRNARIQLATRICKNKAAYYHCITRDTNTLYIYEENYTQININKTGRIKQTRAGIQFQDDTNEYQYNLSKSTLYKKFNRTSDAGVIKIEILAEPLETLVKLLGPQLQELPAVQYEPQDYVVLPLYQTRGGMNYEKKVPARSGLNQWNAGGRQRDYGEVYIPVPAKIHKQYPNFFPPRDELWTLVTPANQEFSAKICQDGGKAIMTKPNKALSDWLLRGALGLKEGELLSYDLFGEGGSR